MLWEWSEHDTTAEGAIPYELNRRTATVVRGSAGRVESELAHHLFI
jgi:hypothetical protein